MTPTLTCLAMALVGVDLGYRPAPNGGQEFIIQVNPATLQSLTRPGDSIGIDATRELQAMRPGRFTVVVGNGPLPHEPPVAALTPPALSPPARAPMVRASPVLPATAETPATYPDAAPVRVAPPGASPGQGESIAADPRVQPSSDQAAGANPGQRIEQLPQIASSGSSDSQPVSAWIGMCLLVIALAASNAYVGWLFWDARQRYRGLLAQSFAFARASAEG